MAYPPSSTVSYFNQICFVSYLNDWLIVDGVFFVIRCIVLLSNKTEKMKHVVYLLFLSKRCSVEQNLYRPTNSRPERSDDSQNAPAVTKITQISVFTQPILSFAKIRPVEMYVRIKQYHSTP